MKQVKAFSCAVAAGLMIFSSMAPSTYAEKNSTQLQAEKDDIQKQVDDLKQTVADAKAKVVEMDKSIQENEKKRDELKTNIAATDQKIAELNAKIEELEQQIKKREYVIKKRLQTLQSQEKENMVADLLINAKSFADLLDRMSSIGMIFESDKSILEAQQRDQDEVERQRAELAKKNAELHKLLAEHDNILAALSAEREQRQNLVDQAEESFLAKVSELSSVATQLSQQRALERAALAVQTMTDGASTAKTTVAPKPVNIPMGTSTGGNGSVVSKAQQYLGVPYVWGGASPSGFDCSGFISYVYGVGRQTAAGFYSSAAKVSNPQPGDLVFFAGTYKAGISHIGIYVGNGMMIHASDDGIAYGNLNSSYNRAHFAGYGRL